MTNEVMRRRSKGQLLPAGNMVELAKNNGASPCGSNSWAVTPNLYGTCLIGVQKTMDDVVTPHFRQRQAKGEMIFNPMRMSVYTSSIDDPGSGPSHRAFPTPTCIIDGQSFFGEIDYASGMLAHVLGGDGTLPIPIGSGIISNNDIENLITEVSTAVIAARGQSSSGLWESVAEFRQTKALFSGPIKYLFNFFRKNGKNMRRMTPAEAWLTYRYGIMPFVHDVTTIVNGLKLPIGVRRDTSRDQRSIRDLGSSMVDAFFTNKYYFQLSCVTQDEIVVRGMSVDEHVANFRDNLGFSTKGLLTVPWDLIPFSFVLDWFVNLGDFLKAYAPSPGYKTIGACITTERTIRTTYTSVNTTWNAGPGAIIVKPLTGTCSATSLLKLRQPIGAPGVVIRSDFRYASLIRVADTMALLSVLAASYFGGGPLPRGSGR
jgi:hypothetical protein